MTNEEILKQFTDSHLTGDWARFDALSTDDLTLLGPAAEPLGKDAFLSWLRSVYEANDDINNNVVVTESSGDTLKCTVQMEGTHARDWDLGFMGLGVIPATHKSWKNPQEEMTVTMSDGKVSELKVSVPAGGGIPGILAQLGVSTQD